jgi:hypothetical protein
MNAPSPSTIALLVLLALLAWRLYARIRRMVGRQRLSVLRPWLTLVLFPALVCLLCYATAAHAERLAWLAGGLGVGVLLGVIGLRHTRYEATPQGLFYTPNAHLGVALSLLFVGRVLFRLLDLPGIEPALPQEGKDFAGSRLTLSVFGVLAGYYIAYAAGLLRWRFLVSRAGRSRAAPGA